MAKAKDPARGPMEFGLGGIFKGLGDLVQKLGSLAEQAGEMRREGTIDGDKGVKAVYGFTVKFGGAGGDKVQLEPFGNVRKDAKGETTVSEEREPVVDVFDEPDCLLVVAELPGVEEGSVQTEVKGDVLLITAEGKGRKYRKEVLLPGSFAPAQESHSLRSGVLEVRLRKGVKTGKKAR